MPEQKQQAWWMGHYLSCCEKKYDEEDGTEFTVNFLYRSVNRPDGDDMDYNWLYRYYKANQDPTMTEEQRQSFGRVKEFAHRVFFSVRNFPDECGRNVSPVILKELEKELLKLAQ